MQVLMSDRFSITLPDEIAADLKIWAESEGRNKANLAGFLVETAVRQRFPDKYPPMTVGFNKPHQKESKDNS
jgi:hypothetical protein